MTAFVVADFVSEDGDDLFIAVAGEQGVIKSDAASFAKAGKEGIAFRGSAGAIDDTDFLHGKVKLFSKCKDGVTQFTSRHGFELEKQGHDDTRSQKCHEHAEAGHEYPGVKRCPGLCLKEPGDDPGHGQTDEDHEGESLEVIGDEGPQGGAIKAVLGFDSKDVPDLEGQGEPCLHEHYDGDDEYTRLNGTVTEQDGPILQAPKSAKQPKNHE